MANEQIKHRVARFAKRSDWLDANAAITSQRSDKQILRFAQNDRAFAAGKVSSAALHVYLTQQD
jgi:hypothetical protein